MELSVIKIKVRKNKGHLCRRPLFAWIKNSICNLFLYRVDLVIKTIRIQ